MEKDTHMKKTWVVIMVAVYLFGGVQAAQAAFMRNSLTVSGLSAGGSCIAVDRSVFAFIQNPAGLITQKQTAAGFSYALPYLGLSNIAIRQQSAAVAVPVNDRVVFGLAGSMVDSSGLLTEQEGILAGAYRINRYLTAGVAATYLFHDYRVSENSLARRDPVFAAGTSKGALDFDAGVVANYGKHYSAALSVRHITMPDAGLATADPIPRESRAGIGASFRKIIFSADAWLRDAGTATGYGQRSGWNAGLDAEVYRLRNIHGKDLVDLRLRCGGGSDLLAGGFGLWLGELTLDYVFTFVENIKSDNSGSHAVAVTYRFPKRWKSWY